MTLIGVIAMLAAAGGVGFWLYRSDPGYWIENQRFIERTEPQTLKAMARNVETKVLHLQSYQGPIPGSGGGPNSSDAQDKSTRHMRVTIDEANAWLSTMLPMWLANQKWQMPSQISQPTVHVKDEDLVLGFKWDSPEISNIFSIVLGVSNADEGMIRVQRKVLYWGRLPMPYSFFLDHLEKRSSLNQRRLIKWLTHMSDGRPQHVTFPYGGDASKQMQLRLIQFRFDCDAIELTMRLEPADETSSSIAPIRPMH